MFDSGSFSEDDTFLLTDWLAHVPKSVLAKNFGMDSNLKAFDHIPEHQLYIFPCEFFSVAHSPNSSDMCTLAIPPPDDIKEDMVVPNDTLKPFTVEFSKIAPVREPGGTVKIVDTRTFKASKKISATEVELDVSGLRYLFRLVLDMTTF